MKCDNEDFARAELVTWTSAQIISKLQIKKLSELPVYFAPNVLSKSEDGIHVKPPEWL